MRLPPCPQSSPPDPESNLILHLPQLLLVFSYSRIFPRYQVTLFLILGRFRSYRSFQPSRSFQQSYRPFPRKPTSRQLRQVRVERNFIAISSPLFTVPFSLCVHY